MMADSVEVPGLVGITEESIDGGGARFIFEIEGGKEQQFFSAFGLQVGDDEGFQRVVIEAISEMLDRMNKRSES